MLNTLNPSTKLLNASAIASTIAEDPLARDILQFLVANENAMDTVKGIAAWWVHNDEVAVEPSLQRLFLCGAITAHTLRSGTTLYRLTNSPEIRSWLRGVLGVPDEGVVSAKEATITARSVTPVPKP